MLLLLLNSTYFGLVCWVVIKGGNLNIYCGMTPILETNVYLIEENNHAIIIDTYDDNNFIKTLLHNNPILDLVILTHEHYDHISGVKLLQRTYSAKVLASKICDKNLRNSKLNLSRYFEAYCELQTGVKIKPHTPIGAFVCHADKFFYGENEMIWQGHSIYFRETPGHSQGSICIMIDNKYLFSGDTILPTIMTITRFPGGSQKEFEERTVHFIKTIPHNVIVYPGHGELSLIGDHPLFKQ